MANVEHILQEKSGKGFEANGRYLPSSITYDDWRSGLSFIEASCNNVKGWYNACWANDNNITVTEKVFVEPTTASFIPFPMYWGEKCLTTDIPDVNLGLRSKSSFIAGRSSVFAQEISTGIYSGNPSFKSVAIPLNDTATDLVNGISWLINERVSNGAIGKHKIHIPALFNVIAQHNNIGSDELSDYSFDNYATSYTPDLLMPNGQPATAPEDDEAWIVITGEYEYGYTNPIYASAEGVDTKSTNSRYSRLENQAIYRFDTCHVYAIKVKLIGC